MLLTDVYWNAEIPVEGRGTIDVITSLNAFGLATRWHILEDPSRVAEALGYKASLSLNINQCAAPWEWRWSFQASRRTVTFQAGPMDLAGTEMATLLTALSEFAQAHSPGGGFVAFECGHDGPAADLEALDQGPVTHHLRVDTDEADPTKQQGVFFVGPTQAAIDERHATYWRYVETAAFLQDRFPGLDGEAVDALVGAAETLSGPASGRHYVIGSFDDCNAAFLTDQDPVSLEQRARSVGRAKRYTPEDVETIQAPMRPAELPLLGTDFPDVFGIYEANGAQDPLQASFNLSPLDLVRHAAAAGRHVPMVTGGDMDEAERIVANKSGSPLPS